MKEIRIGFVYKYISEIKAVLILGKDDKGFKLFLAKADKTICSKTIVLYIINKNESVVFLDSLDNILENKDSIVCVKSKEKVEYGDVDFYLNEYEVLLVENTMLKRELLKYNIDALCISDVIKGKEAEIKKGVESLNFDRIFEKLSVEYVESFCRRIGKDDMYVLSKVVSLPYEVDSYVEKLLNIGKEIVFYDSGYIPAEQMKPDWDLGLKKVDAVKDEIITNFKQNYDVKDHVRQLVYEYVDELFCKSKKMTEIKELLAVNDYKIKEQWDFVNIKLVPLIYSKINNASCFMFIEDVEYVEKCKTDISNYFVEHVERYIIEFNLICERYSHAINDASYAKQNCNRDLAIELTKHAKDTMKCWLDILEEELSKASGNYDCDSLF